MNAWNCKTQLYSNEYIGANQLMKYEYKMMSVPDFINYNMFYWPW